jgi:hypothetical protein
MKIGAENLNLKRVLVVALLLSFVLVLAIAEGYPRTYLALFDECFDSEICRPVLHVIPQPYWFLRPSG